MTKKLCLKRYWGNDASLEAFLACKIIPLDKNSEVRPIETGEVIRRILGPTVMKIFRWNTLERAGDFQLCAGRHVGRETAVHALSSMLIEYDSDAILLVVADNAFNRINRNIMLHNIRIVCPINAAFIMNSYSREARLFISGDKEITSAERTTQGDPTAIPIYVLGRLALLNITATDNTKYAA